MPRPGTLRPIDSLVEVLPLDRLYLFPRERLEDVNQGEELDLLFPEYRTVSPVIHHGSISRR